jgi:four helix bundle protein
MAVKNYRELIVWQKAMDLVEAIYRETAGFPKEETYGLTIQLRRAAVSIPSNIAEGQGRRSTRDFLRFLSIANGSLREVETQITIARRLNYIQEERETVIFEMTSEVARLLHGLIRSLDEELPP